MTIKSIGLYKKKIKLNIIYLQIGGKHSRLKFKHQESNIVTWKKM
jgi:hypothetical protein